jgi:hypothetical protein
MSSLLRIIVLNSIGPLWALILAPGLFENYFYSAFSADGVDVKQLLHGDVFTAFSIYWVCTMIAQIWWLWRAEINMNAPQLLPKAKATWWILASILMLAGIILMALYVWIPYPQLPITGLLLLVFLNSIDFLILFWMATATGTPGMYRSVVPGAKCFE